MYRPIDFAFLIALIAAVQDLMQFRISNNLTYPAILTGLIWHAWHSGWTGLGSSGLGVAIPLVCLFPVFLARGFGAGDLKLLMGLGAWLGPRSIGNLLLIALTINGLVCAVVQLTRRGNVGLMHWISLEFGRVLARLGLAPRKTEPAEGGNRTNSKTGEAIPFAAVVLIGMVAVFHFGLVIL